MFKSLLIIVSVFFVLSILLVVLSTILFNCIHRYKEYKSNFDKTAIKMKWSTVKSLMAIAPNRWEVVLDYKDSSSFVRYVTDEAIKYRKPYDFNRSCLFADDFELSRYTEKIKFNFFDWIKFVFYLKKEERADMSNQRKEEKVEYNKRLASILNSCQKDIDTYKEKAEKEMNLVKDIVTETSKNFK